MKKVRYYWARIGAGNPEPVAVVGQKPHRIATTLGCPDTFAVDDPDPAIMLYEDEFDALRPPLTPEQEERALKRERRAAALLISHRYAGFGRKDSAA